MWEEALSTVVREAQLTLIKLMLISSQQTDTWAQSQYKDENSSLEVLKLQLQVINFNKLLNSNIHVTEFHTMFCIHPGNP